MIYEKMIENKSKLVFIEGKFTNDLDVEETGLFDDPFRPPIII